MHLVLLFSFEISLEDWSETGILAREVLFYQGVSRRYGVTSKFLTYGGQADQECSARLAGIQILPAYRARPTASGRLGRLITSLFLPWRLHKELGRVDVFKSNQMMGAWVGVVSKLRFGKPFLLRTGYELSEFLRLGKAPWWHRVGGWILSYISYQLADRIHVATRADKKIIEKRFRVPAAKIYVQPNWIDTRTFSPLRNEHDEDDGVLFVGRFAEQKNLPLLIDALTTTDLKLTIVGAGKDELRIREKIELAEIDAKILGSTPNSRMPALYQQCSIYVICSRYEGNPKALLEAMACGCAVIGTDVIGVRGIIQHGKNGMLVKEDVFSLRSAILKLADDRQLREALGKAARESVLRDYSLDSATEAEWRAYNAMTVESRTR